MKKNNYYAAILWLLTFLLPILAAAQVKQLNNPIDVITPVNQPVYWVNQAHEFNVCIETEDSYHLYTLLNESDPEIELLPEFDSIAATENYFALHSINGNSYAFVGTITGRTQYIFPVSVAYFGYGVSHHYWAKSSSTNRTLAALKVAKSIYNVL